MSLACSVRLTLIEGRGRCFARGGALDVRVVDATGVRTRACASSVGEVAPLGGAGERANAVVRWREEHDVEVYRGDDEIELALIDEDGVNGGGVGAMSPTSRSGDAGASASAPRGRLSLKALLDASGASFMANAVVPGAWVVLRDVDSGEECGRVCVRVRVREVGAGKSASATKTKTKKVTVADDEDEDVMKEDLDESIVVETSGSEDEDEDEDFAQSGRRRGASTSGASSEREPRKNPVNVVGKFLLGVLKREKKDEDAKRAEKERKREERKREIEAKKVEKERAKYEREEAKRIETEREEAMKRRLEVDRMEYEREQREAAASAAAAAAETSSEIEETSPGTPEQRQPEPTAFVETPEKIHHLHLPNVHLPNVDEIKHQVHHIQDVLRDQGGRLKRNLDEQVHHLGEHVHHLGEHVHHLGEHVGEQIHHAQENIRDTSGKVGKRLAKNKFLRTIAERVSPNSILMLAIAFFLAGLPENRVRKVRDHKRRELHSQQHREEERRRHEQIEKIDEIYVDEVAEEYVDEPAYIGRGPTPRGVYEIVEGDTLCSIAGCFNLALVEIIDKNGDVITNPDELEPGSRIRIY